MSGGVGSSSEKDREKETGASKAWGILIFGIIGATATTFAITQVRRSVDWINSHLNRMQSTRRSNTNRSGFNSSSSSNFSEEAWKRYNRRMQEELIEELERIERIRRMQSVFNREREKHRRGYENWREGNSGTGEYRYVPRDDWYWKTENNTYHKAKPHSSHNTRTYVLSHHYSILGLDRARTKPYTEAEIKTAFRTKAMECHPDQNQDNKEAAEEKFKEVMKSYEAIKQERKDERN